jgi:hypothetical protein
MARKPWAGEEKISREEAEATADTAQLEQQASIAGHWTVTDIVAELGGPGRGGGTRRLAEQLLAAKGITSPTKAHLSGEMRNVNRYMQYERTGVRSTNSFAPARGVRQVVNQIGNADAATRGGTLHIHLSGPISVQGYKRHREIDIFLEGETAASWLQNPDWDTLATEYLNNPEGELHAYEGSSIEIEWL